MHTKYTRIKMKNEMISARVELNNYANKVLGIIKIKFGLRDKSEALNKFIELYGDDVMDQEATEEYTKKIIEVTKKHFDKYQNKKMSIAELDNLFES